MIICCFKVCFKQNDFSDEYYQGVRYSQKLCIKCSFPNLPIVEPPNLSFPNTYRVTKCKNSEIKM